MAGVDSLIEQATVSSLAEIPAAAIVDLKKVLAHNDSSPRNQRVNAEKVMKHLADEYGLTMGRSRFDRIVKRYLGRGFGC